MTSRFRDDPVNRDTFRRILQQPQGITQPPVTDDGPPTPRAGRLPHQQQRQLPGEYLVIRQPVVGDRVAGVGVHPRQGIIPPRPLIMRQPARLDPFAKRRCGGETGFDNRSHACVR